MDFVACSYETPLTFEVEGEEGGVVDLQEEVLTLLAISTNQEDDPTKYMQPPFCMTNIS